VCVFIVIFREVRTSIGRQFTTEMCDPSLVVPSQDLAETCLMPIRYFSFFMASNFTGQLRVLNVSIGGE
jgi:hypothetical protein